MQVFSSSEMSVEMIYVSRALVPLRWKQPQLNLGNLAWWLKGNIETFFAYHPCFFLSFCRRNGQVKISTKKLFYFNSSLKLLIWRLIKGETQTRVYWRGVYAACARIYFLTLKESALTDRDFLTCYCERNRDWSLRFIFKKPRLSHLGVRLVIPKLHVDVDRRAPGSLSACVDRCLWRHTGVGTDFCREWYTIQ